MADTDTSILHHRMIVWSRTSRDYRAMREGNSAGTPKADVEAGSSRSEVTTGKEERPAECSMGAGDHLGYVEYQEKTLIIAVVVHVDDPSGDDKVPSDRFKAFPCLYSCNPSDLRNATTVRSFLNRRLRQPDTADSWVEENTTVHPVLWLEDVWQIVSGLPFPETLDQMTSRASGISMPFSVYTPHIPYDPDGLSEHLGDQINYFTLVTDDHPDQGDPENVYARRCINLYGRFRETLARGDVDEQMLVFVNTQYLGVQWPNASDLD